VTSMAFGSIYGFGKCFHQRLVKGTAMDDVTGLYEMPPGRLTNSCSFGICILDWFQRGSFDVAANRCWCESWRLASS
jgi:hypothetical protein